jgi:hypothetical protein
MQRQANNMPRDVSRPQAGTIFRLMTLRRRINPNMALTKSKRYLTRNWPRMEGGRGRRSRRKLVRNEMGTLRGTMSRYWYNKPA